MEDIRKAAALFKALGDENRLKIVDMLRDGELCACKLLEALGIGQPTLSHHMKILCDSGLVAGRKEGKWMHYSICSDGAKNMRAMLRELLSPNNIPENCSCKEE